MPIARFKHMMVLDMPAEADRSLRRKQIFWAPGLFDVRFARTVIAAAEKVTVHTDKGRVFERVMR